MLTIPPGGQAARLGSELFPNPAAGGWVYIFTDTDGGMQAFWMSYDAGLTFLDGAEAAQYDTIGADQVIPLVAGEAELNIINPNFSTSALTIRLFGGNGEIAPRVQPATAIAGGFQAQISSMFPSADMTQARYIRVRSALAIASSAMIRGFLVPTESVVVNGVNVSPRTEATFPHVINGALAGANYTTVIGLTNTSAASQTVTITYNGDGRDPIAVTRTVPANGALRETAESLFGLAADFQSGWVQASGTAAIIGFAAYADTLAGSIAVVPAGIPQTNLFFLHIADGLPQWQTGLALLNPGVTPANVEVYAVNPSGSLIGGAANVSSARFTLNPGEKTAKVLHEWIPQTRGVNGGYVYVRTSDNAPLLGIELFYTEDLKVLSNVAAGKLFSGVKYTPPSPVSEDNLPVKRFYLAVMLICFAVSPNFARAVQSTSMPGVENSVGYLASGTSIEPRTTSESSSMIHGTFGNWTVMLHANALNSGEFFGIPFIHRCIFQECIFVISATTFFSNKK